MNRGFGFVLAVPLFICCVLLMSVVKYVREETYAYHEYILNYAIDYATDAAAGEILEATDIGHDYQFYGRVNTDPEVALKTFQTCFLLSYDYPLTDKSYEMLETGYMPFFCVAAYDGFYLYEWHKDNDRGHSLQTPAKIPYQLVKNGKYHALNLGYETCYVLDNAKLKLRNLPDTGISKQDAKIRVNTLLSDALSTAYYNYATTGAGDVPYQVEIPSDMSTMRMVLPVEGPSVISIIEEWDARTYRPISATSIGGARVEPSRQVAVYMRQNEPGGPYIKYYCYADLLPKFQDENWEIQLDDLLPTPEMAAQRGYHWDPRYME